MMQVISATESKVTIQFTGSDLKAWYNEHCTQRVYICHVLEGVVTDLGVCEKGFLFPDSHEVIGQLKAIVPKRFKKTGSISSCIEKHLLRKYQSSQQHPSTEPAHVRTRKTLLKCVPDDHVFTLEFR